MILLGKPQIDINILVKSANEMRDSIITSKYTNEYKIIDLLRKFTDDGNVIQHLDYMFLVLSTRTVLADLAMESELKLTVMDSIREDITLAIVSGILPQWVDAICNCSTHHVSSSVRKLVNEFYMYFVMIGLQDIFREFEKKKYKDGTFLLERK
jgi:hypothetical protein